MSQPIVWHIMCGTACTYNVHVFYGVRHFKLCPHTYMYKYALKNSTFFFSREQEGCGLSDLVACDPIRSENGRIFIKHDEAMISTKHTSPLHTHTPSYSPHHIISPHKRVIVSKQDSSAWAVAMGTVTMTTDKEIELLLDK